MVLLRPHDRSLRLGTDAPDEIHEIPNLRILQSRPKRPEWWHVVASAISNVGKDLIIRLPVLPTLGPGQIGQAIARRVGVGKHVLLADNRRENAQAAADTLANVGYDVSVETVDVSSRKDVLALVEVHLREPMDVLPDRGEALLRPILEAAERSGWRESAAITELVLGLCIEARGDHDRAVAQLAHAAETADEHGIPAPGWEAHQYAAIR